MHITSLPGPYGIGEIGPHAYRFIDTLRQMDIGVWQFLPTGPTAYGDSPYQPLSSFAGNEMFIINAPLTNNSNALGVGFDDLARHDQRLDLRSGRVGNSHCQSHQESE